LISKWIFRDQIFRRCVEKFKLGWYELGHGKKSISTLFKCFNFGSKCIGYELSYGLLTIIFGPP
jgi:hypothetical protein